MHNKNTYNNVRSEDDMERSKAYDLAIKESLKGRNYKFENNDANCVYLNEEYRSALLKKIAEKELNRKYSGEINRFYGKDKKTKCKMCSIASSSRLCFLKFINEENIVFEKVVDNGNVCKPHLDAYLPGDDENADIYYECKCHEIVLKHNLLISKNYDELLNEYFIFKKSHSIDEKDEKKYSVDFSNFGIETNIECGEYFDFKQFICHILGLLTSPKSSGLKKPALQYVFFMPDDKYLEEIDTLKTWKKEFDDMIGNLFPLLRDMKVKSDKGIVSLSECIDLKDPEIVKVSEVDDIVLKTIVEKEN